MTRPASSHFSRIGHLARSIYLSKYRTTYVAMFKTSTEYTAYFGAGKAKRQRVLTMAGFVSPTPKWIRFESQWSEILSEIPATRFRMTNFVGSRDGFRGWEGRTSKRVVFLNRLLACIRQNIYKGFAVGLLMRDYNEVSAESQSSGVEEPRVLCGLACLAKVKHWLKQKGIDLNDVLCIFEDADDGQDDLIRRARAEGFNAIAQSKGEIRAFDACDLAAWKALSVLDDSYNKQFHLIDPRGADRVMHSLTEIEPMLQVHGLKRNSLLKSSHARKLGQG